MIRGKVDQKMWLSADQKELNYNRDLADELMGMLNEAGIDNLSLYYFFNLQNDLNKVKSVRDKRQA